MKIEQMSEIVASKFRYDCIVRGAVGDTNAYEDRAKTAQVSIWRTTRFYFTDLKTAKSVLRYCIKTKRYG